VENGEGKRRNGGIGIYQTYKNQMVIVRLVSRGILMLNSMFVDVDWMDGYTERYMRQFRAGVDVVGKQELCEMLCCAVKHTSLIFER
jgi:hypothetical protein